MKYALLLAAASIVAPLSAQAADLPLSDPTMVVASAPWEGFYAGLQTSFGNYETKDNLGSPKLEMDAWSFGGFAGYNMQMDNVVLGLELDAAYHDASKVSALNIRNRTTWSAGLSARAGYAIENFMPYLRAGVGFHDGELYRASTGQKSDTTHSYFEFGGGFEALVTDNVSLRAEVIHRMSSEESYTLNTTFKGDLNSTLGRFGVSYHF